MHRWLFQANQVLPATLPAKSASIVTVQDVIELREADRWEESAWVLYDQDPSLQNLLNRHHFDILLRGIHSRIYNFKNLASTKDEHTLCPDAPELIPPWWGDS